MGEIRYVTYKTASFLTMLAVLGATAVHAQSIPDDFLIRLERTTCFGECPAYSVSIDGHGNATYEGTAAVRVKGQQVAKIPMERVVALVQTVDRIRFEELRPRYAVAKAADGSEHPVIVDDAPTSYITLTRNGRTKEVEDHFGAPDGLKDLVREIDDAAGTKRWIRIEGEAVLALGRTGWRPSVAEGAELLRRALMYDDVDAVAALLEIGVDPNTMYYGTHTPPLMMVRSAAAARALLSAGADPSALNDNGGTALGHAADLAPDVTEVLLKGGAQASQPIYNSGHTALYNAACTRNAGVVKLLLGAAAPTEIVAALECARRRLSLGPDPLFPNPAYINTGLRLHCSNKLGKGDAVEPSASQSFDWSQRLDGANGRLASRSSRSSIRR
jgi:hypothetical protein